MIDTHNRRKATRLPVEIPVDYLGKEFLGNGMVINVSPYGVLIHGDYLPILGTYLSLRLFPPSDKEPLAIERAVVRWQRGSKLGVEIITMTPEAHVRLIELMTSVLKHLGCVCAPKLPWLCHCLTGPLSEQARTGSGIRAGDGWAPWGGAHEEKPEQSPGLRLKSAIQAVTTEDD